MSDVLYCINVQCCIKLHLDKLGICDTIILIYVKVYSLCVLEDDTDVGTHRIPLTASGPEMGNVHGNCQTKRVIVDTGQVQGV